MLVLHCIRIIYFGRISIVIFAGPEHGRRLQWSEMAGKKPRNEENIMIKWTRFVLKGIMVGHGYRNDKEGATLHFQNCNVALSKCHLTAKKGQKCHITAGMGSCCIVRD